MTEISFQEEGKGRAVLLIHGFPMSSEIWGKFSAGLTPSFRVITIDLPGFGKSPLPLLPFTLEEIADSVLAKLDALNISEVIPIGHSLGGYVALAMVARKPSLFPGLGLLHSTARADSPEKKSARDKTIAFIKKNGAMAFTSNFINTVFADSDHPDVPFVREMNIQAETPALIGYTAAMRDRPDRIALLASFDRPVLFITGARDPGIPADDVREQAAIAPKGEAHVLEDQAHMGLIEDVPTTSSLVYDFIIRCYE